MHGAAENQTHEKLICKTLHSSIVNSQNIIFQAEAFFDIKTFYSISPSISYKKEN